MLKQWLVLGILNMQNFVLHILKFMIYARNSRAFSPKHICVYRIGNIGDLLCTVPALWQIRSKYPEAKITLLSSPGKKGAISARAVLQGFSFVLGISVPSISRCIPPQSSNCLRGTILGDTIPACICRATGVFAQLAPGDTRGTRRLGQSFQVLLHSTNLPSRLAGVTRTYFMDEPILFNLRIFHPQLLEQASLLVAPLL